MQPRQEQTRSVLVAGTALAGLAWILRAYGGPVAPQFASPWVIAVGPVLFPLEVAAIIQVTGLIALLLLVVDYRENAPF